jgi:hypothetical protein
VPAEAAKVDVALGPIRVRVDEEHVARYRRETGFDDAPEEIVPVAFPAVWLMAEEVRSAIAGQLDGENAVPVHESQSFHYYAPLRMGESYDLTFALRREQTPPRLVVEASVSTTDGELRLQAETVLRIVPRPAAMDAAP